MRATSATDAWAIGDYYNGMVDKTLILHWNGSTGRSPPVPTSVHGSNDLSSIGGTSPANLYAVGQSVSGSTSDVLIVHWNGSRWRVVPGQNPGSAGNTLDAIYPQIADQHLGRGSFGNGHFNRTLIEHCG